jgi:hypothetical protein
MFRLEQGRSYTWLFAIYGIALFGGFYAWTFLFRGRFWGILAIPAVTFVVVSSELRSGVALDSMWCASHAKGTAEYREATALHASFAVVASAFCYYLLFFDPMILPRDRRATSATSVRETRPLPCGTSLVLLCKRLPLCKALGR